MEKIEKEFYVRALVDVYEDSYSEGELNQVNYYEESSYLKAPNINEAIKRFFNDRLCFSIDLDALEFDNENNCFSYSVLCDNDNNEVTKEDNIYKEWKKGKIKLYINNINLYIYELNSIKTIDK